MTHAMAKVVSLAAISKLRSDLCIAMTTIFNRYKARVSCSLCASPHLRPISSSSGASVMGLYPS